MVLEVWFLNSSYHEYFLTRAIFNGHQNRLNSIILFSTPLNGISHDCRNNKTGQRSCGIIPSKRSLTGGNFGNRTKKVALIQFPLLLTYLKKRNGLFTNEK
uniref:Uncharacterized protein n=1 Tax=Oryza brachyantha TaxID=4533 RepID=J3MR20_ORYBR